MTRGSGKRQMCNTWQETDMWIATVAGDICDTWQWQETDM